MATSDLSPSVPFPQRVVGNPDPAQQGAFEHPIVIETTQEELLTSELSSELAAKGFNTRQISEAIGHWKAYCRQSRAWQSTFEATQKNEIEGDGFRARALDFFAACRAQNVHFKAPKVLDAQSIEKVLLKTTKKHDKITMKVAGGLIGLAIAILLKAYLLLPIANAFLGKLLGPGESLTKGVFAFMLACVIAYSITYAMRFLMQLFVHLNAGDKIKDTRSLGELLNLKTIKLMLWVIGIMFAIVIYSLLRYDVGSATAVATENESGAYSAYGLNFLFLVIVIVYELAVAYRTAYYQIAPPVNLADDIIALHNQAVIRYHDEEDLARMRTLTLLQQQRWAEFMRELDSGAFEGKKAVVNRTRAMARMRGTRSHVVSAFGPRR